MSTRVIEEPRFQRTEPSVMELFREFFREAGAYVRDLALLFVSELREKTTLVKSAVIAFAVAAFVGVFAFLFLSVALVGAIAYGLGSWGWAFFIVGLGYGIIAGLVALPAARNLKRANLKFDKTMARLRDDGDYFKQKLAA